MTLRTNSPYNSQKALTPCTVRQTSLEGDDAMSMFPRFTVQPAKPALVAEVRPKFSNKSRKSRLFKELKNVMVDLNNIYPAGAIPWASENRPDLLRFCRGAECSVDRAILEEDRTGFYKAIKNYSRAYKDVFCAYENAIKTFPRKQP